MRRRLAKPSQSFSNSFPLSCEIVRKQSCSRKQADEKVCNIVHLIYRSKPYEGVSKDFEFSRRTMVEHWQAGFEDAVRSLSHPEVLQRPDRLEGVRTFDWSKTAPAA